MPMTIAAALATGRQQLRDISGAHVLEARSLLADVLACEVSFLLAHDDDQLTAAQQDVYQQALQRRVSGEPLAYILGWREFYGLRLRVNNSVLIPRPETEMLVDLALQCLSSDGPVSILDLGTGSGAIALALAAQLSTADLVAADISAEALLLAQHNAEQHSLTQRIRFHQGNWYQALPDGLNKFDLIISNPPYVAADDAHLLQGDCRHEPRLALTPGVDDLASYRHIVAGAKDWLQPGGWLLFEHGHDQRQRLLQLFADPHWQPPQAHEDLAGIERVIMAQYDPSTTA